MRSHNSLAGRVLVISLLAVLSAAPPLFAQLFDNLEAFSSRLDLGDPATVSRWEWGKEGPKSVAVADLDRNGQIDMAASNLDGTVTEEKIAHDAGATTQQELTVDELVRLIREAGRRPVERDTVFNVVREW